MRLHPITQLMLLAAMLIFGADAAWLIALGKALHGSGVPPFDASASVQIGFWGWMVAPPLQMVAYVFEALGLAFAIEVLSRILADLKRRNLAPTER